MPKTAFALAIAASFALLGTIAAQLLAPHEIASESKAESIVAEPMPDIAGEIAANMNENGCKVEKTGDREYTLRSC